MYREAEWIGRLKDGSLEPEKQKELHSFIRIAIYHNCILRFMLPIAWRMVFDLAEIAFSENVSLDVAEIDKWCRNMRDFQDMKGMKES